LPRSGVGNGRFNLVPSPLDAFFHRQRLVLHRYTRAGCNALNMSGLFEPAELEGMRSSIPRALLELGIGVPQATPPELYDALSDLIILLVRNGLYNSWLYTS
jgi:hypothetical protein